MNGKRIHWKFNLAISLVPIEYNSTWPWWSKKNVLLDEHFTVKYSLRRELTFTSQIK